jgi:tetratricopeptide (TPR) repeat protein
MKIRESLGKSLLTLVLTWAFLMGSIPVHAQGDFVTSSDISGGSSVFVFRSSRKAKKKNFVARRRSKAKRTVKQRRSTRRKVVRQSKQVAKRNRNRRTIKKVSPQDFKKVEIQLARKSPQEASKIFTGAAEYFIEEESNLEKAAAFLEEAISLDANNNDAKLAYSELSVTLGNKALDETQISRDLRFRKAESWFNQAVKYDPKNALAFVGLAQVYDEQEKNDLARENYEKALELDSGLSEVKAALSFIYYGDGRLDDADVLIGQALEGGQDNAEIQYFLGLIKYKKGADNEAAAALQSSIDLDSENAEAHYYLGAVLARMGESNKAIQSFERSTTLDPSFVNAWFALGVEHYNNERYPDAIAALDKSVADNTNNNDELRRIYAESFVNLAESYRQTEQFDKAISKYRIAVSLIKDDDDLYSTFGFVLGSKGLWKDAITNFEKAIEIKPDSINHANLGWAYLKSAINNREVRYYDREKADLEKSKGALYKAVELDPNLVAANLNLGSVLNDLGEHSAAIEVLSKAIDLKDDWMPAHYELGEAYLESGDYDNAVTQFKRVIKLDKKFAFAHYNLGRAEHMRGKKKNAKKALKDLRKLDVRLADRLDRFFLQNPR